MRTINSIKVRLKEVLIDDISLALNELIKLLKKDSSLYNDVVLALTRHANVENRYHEGTINTTDYNIIINKLVSATINYIDRLSDVVVNESGIQGFLGEFKVIEDSDPGVNKLYSSRYNLDLLQNYKEFIWEDKAPKYLETFDFHNSKSLVFKAYEEEIWAAKYEKGSYELLNESRDLAVKYHHLNFNREDMSNYATGVEVKIEEIENSSSLGGLLFSFNPDENTYYAFMISNDCQYTLWERSIGGFKSVVSKRSNRIVSNAYNEIGVIKVQSIIYLFINRIFVQKILGNELVGANSGIICANKGRFNFDNLSFYEL